MPKAPVSPLSQSQRLARAFADLGGDRAASSVLEGLAGPVPSARKRSRSGAGAAKRERALAERRERLNRAGSSADPAVLAALVEDGDESVLHAVVVNAACPVELVRRGAERAAASGAEPVFAAALARLPFVDALAVFDGLPASSPLRSSQPVVSALVLLVSPASCASEVSLLLARVTPDLLEDPVVRWLGNLPAASAFAAAAELERVFPAPALTAVLNALDGSVNVFGPVVVDEAVAALLVRLCDHVGEGAALDALESLDWVLEEDSFSGTVTPDAGLLLAASSFGPLQSLALAVRLPEEVLLSLVAGAGAELLYRMSGAEGVTFPVLEAVRGVLPRLGPEGSDVADSFLSSAFESVSGVSAQDLAALAVEFSAAWDGEEVAHPELVRFVLGRWEVAPDASVVETFPRAVLADLGKALVLHGSDREVLDLSSPVLERVFESAPGVLVSWLALPPSRWRNLLGVFLRSRLESVLGGDREGWELALGLADGFEGGVLELAGAASALRSAPAQPVV